MQVDIFYYEDAFHGICSLIDKNTGFNIARKMLDDMINYINLNI